MDRYNRKVFGLPFVERYGESVPRNREDAARLINTLHVSEKIECTPDQLSVTIQSWCEQPDLALCRDTDDNWCPDMVIIPTGENFIGSRPDEWDRDSFESPVTYLRVHERFALGRFPITLGQFNYFAADTGHVADQIFIWGEKGWQRHKERDWRDPGFEQNDHHPVVGVSYSDARLYCRWLSAKTGARYRLPSEAEWEYACRAGTQTAFSWGNDISPENARYDAKRPYKSGRSSEQFLHGTAAVDAYPPNQWGLYQMHGNIWEWCADAWNDNHYDHPTNCAPRTDGDNGRAVVKGGSWLSIPNKLRAGKRDWDGKPLRGDTVGFRVVREI